MNGRDNPEILRLFEEKLSSRGVVSREEMELAQRSARQGGLTLPDALVTMGILTEDQIGTLMAEIHGVPYVFPYANAVDSDLLPRFPIEVLRRHVAIPFLRERDHVLLATPDVTNERARAELERVAGIPVRFALASRRRVERVLAEVYGPEQVPRYSEDPGGIALLYGHLASALRHKATEVRFEPGPYNVAVRYRIGDRLELRGFEPLSSHLALLARARVLVGPSPAGVVATQLASQDMTLEVAFLPTRCGDSILVRIRPMEVFPSDLSRIPIDGSQLRDLKQVFSASRGLVLVAASNVLRARGLAYALLRGTDPVARAVVTIESPIHESEPLFRQVEFGSKTLQELMRLALGYRPDVIYVGVPPAGRNEVDQLLHAADECLAIAVAEAPDAEDVVEAWVDQRVAAGPLGRALTGLVTVQAGWPPPIRLVRGGQSLRESLARRATAEGA